METWVSLEKKVEKDRILWYTGKRNSRKGDRAVSAGKNDVEKDVKHQITNQPLS